MRRISRRRVMEHGLKGWDTDFLPRRNNSNTDWTDDADLRGFSRFRVDLIFFVHSYEGKIYHPSQTHN